MNQAAAASVRRLGLLDTGLVHALERMRLVPRVLRTATTRGDRLAGKGGASTDFADYRDYVAGDDLRAVDWNAFMRLRRPYLKTYRREEDRHLVVIIDCSRSMGFEGKLSLARSLASALAVPALAASDRVSVWAPGAIPGDRLLAPVRGRQALGRVLAAIAGLPAEAVGAPLPDAIAAVCARHQGRGAALVLSDFLLAGDVRRALGRLSDRGLEILALQILAPSELDPGLEGDLRLVDSETGESLDLSTAGDALALYQEHRRRWCADLASWLSASGGRFAGCSAADDVQELVLGRLRRQGWLA
jgi:uncharacterized protein (DUF58 family)